MILIDVSQLELPWIVLDGDGSSLISELQREVSRGHVLFGKQGIKAIAKRVDCDDVLFALQNVLAVVHLAWSGQEQNPQWPYTTLYGSWTEFLTERMRKDVVEYSGDAV